MQEAACESNSKAASGLVQDGLIADRLQHGCSTDVSKSKRHLVPRQSLRLHVTHLKGTVLKRHMTVL